jgi:hypothetical protein
MRKTITWFLVLILMSCSHYKYWDLSKFKMVKGALKENEEVKLLYTSNGPDNNTDLSYFIHIIAVSKKTGDTVNILTTHNNGVEKSDGDKVFNFISPESDMARFSNIGVTEDIDPDHPEEILNAKKPDLSGIKRVARDPDHDDIADNIYPTVIGWIGTYTRQ